MANELSAFVLRASRLLDLAFTGAPVADQLGRYWENRSHLAFLKDLVGRARMLERAIDRFSELSDSLREIRSRVQNLPADERGWRTIPDQLWAEEQTCLTEIDFCVSFFYYETKSILDMLGQIHIKPEATSELHYLEKVRDRFLSHVQLAGVRRGEWGSMSIPERGRIHRDVVALNSWYSDDMRALGYDPATITAGDREAVRAENERLILSGKKNEKFTQQEIVKIMFAGVRECDFDVALTELSALLETELIPVIKEHTEIAINEFGMERIP